MREHHALRYTSLSAKHQALLLGRSGAVKRLIDVIGAAIGLLLSAPLMVLIPIFIRLDSPGPVLFIQRRVGLFGRSFQVYKFRTMVVNAEELLDQLIDIQELDEPAFKIQDDPRVTPVGRFLRRWSFDEIPQFLNVLKGEMSLVGPRPEEVRLVERYNDYFRCRLLAKPGMTGPVQVGGRGDLSLGERVQLEIDYIQDYSLGKDLQILLKTIPVVLKGDGSYWDFEDGRSDRLVTTSSPVPTFKVFEQLELDTKSGLQYWDRILPRISCKDTCPLATGVSTTLSMRLSTTQYYGH